MTTFNITSPIDNQVIATFEAATSEQINQTINKAVAAQKTWQETSIEQRAKMLNNAIQCIVMNQKQLGQELTRLMGRPIRYSAGEIAGLAERGRYMIDIAPGVLRDLTPERKPGVTRFIRREPLGVVFTIAPWNYPYLTAVNSVIPALMAGNTVILKHSTQTLPIAENFKKAMECAELPPDILQVLHLDHRQTAQVIQHQDINFVSFTGSVGGGEAIEAAAAGQFMGVALELGGKDPAYVRHDADIRHTAEQIADGAFFNSGQSCCGIERVYVQQSVYEEFVKTLVELAGQYVLGDPLDEQTTLGPMVSAKAADLVRQQVTQAVEKGAIAHIDTANFPLDKAGTPYMAPQVLTGVDHTMSIMTEESFGPVVGVMAVADDNEAITLMNDSQFGLTASIWTKDQAAAIGIGSQLQTGTVFMNRCDYLDPALPWVGVKQSGRGCALSVLGYEQLTRPKSYNLNE
jgi:acyl-CoA reductase-like NAD-dependent aldehyde dehydrogenase